MYWLWDPDPVAFAITDFGVSWYGLLWALGFLFAQRLVILMYRKEGKPGRDLDALLVYLIVGTVVGARIGHCLFYDPLYYVHNPLSVFKVWEGGLASHGAAAGLLTALYVFSRRKKDQPFLWLVDRVAVAAALVGGLVRIGNFINSEVIGTPTRCSFGVVFVAPIHEAVLSSDPSIAGVEIRRIDTLVESPPGIVPLSITVSTRPSNPSGEWRLGVLQRVRAALLAHPSARLHIQPEGLSAPSLPGQNNATGMTLFVAGIARHPVQLYEGAVGLVLALVLFLLWRKHQSQLLHGSLFGWYLVAIFASRFVLEYLKESVTPIEAGWPFSIGQLLSIPFVLSGFWLLVHQNCRRQT